MQTRIIHTKVWEDQWFRKLNKDAKFLWLYLLSSDKINISGVFELNDDKILFDTSIHASIGALLPSEDRLEEDLKYLQELKKQLTPKAMFLDGWVKICNVNKYNNYINSPKNQVAYLREISYVPDKVKEYFDIVFDTSINTSIHTPRNQKPEIVNTKSGIQNPKPTLSDSAKLFMERLEEVRKGKSQVLVKTA